MEEPGLSKLRASQESAQIFYDDSTALLLIMTESRAAALTAAATRLLPNAESPRTRISQPGTAARAVWTTSVTMLAAPLPDAARPARSRSRQPPVRRSAWRWSWSAASGSSQYLLTSDLGVPETRTSFGVAVDRAWQRVDVDKPCYAPASTGAFPARATRCAQAVKRAGPVLDAVRADAHPGEPHPR